ncbi:MAG: nuclear transport factor 2 family protein [Acidimicrobiales bacterium]
MDDEAAIAALVHAYAERIDLGDLDGVAALFAHATWRAEATGVVLRGVEQVRSVYDGVRLYDGVPRTKHVITNLVIDVDAGRASAGSRCCFTVLQGVTPGEPIETILSGRYIDRFEHREAWRFADRLICADLIGDQRRHFG